MTLARPSLLNVCRHAVIATVRWELENVPETFSGATTLATSTPVLPITDRTVDWPVLLFARSPIALPDLG